MTILQFPLKRFPKTQKEKLAVDTFQRLRDELVAMEVSMHFLREEMFKIQTRMDNIRNIVENTTIVIND